jgi:hypothetical protein
VASYASVVLQLKFYNYHWGTAVAASGLFGAALYRDMANVGSRRAGWLAPAGFVSLVGFFYLASGPPMQSWLSTVRTTAGYLSGTISREQFTHHFDIPAFYSAHDTELAGTWLREHAGDGDTLLVRGFEPEIYARSGLHYTGRFFWTSFLTMSTRIYKRGEWLAEDAAAFEENPPRWGVALTYATAGLDSPRWFAARGYERRAAFGVVTILERKSPVAAH